jgi:UDP-glucuronate 4-epimerase
VKVLVTGAAGFIGYHTCEHLLGRDLQVVGLDSLNDYYDPALKRSRLERLRRHANFQFVHADLSDRAASEALFKAHRFERVVHLAAQAGVRFSIQHPHAYVQSNVVGFLHVLEGCRYGSVEHLVYASTSSVYGANASLPYNEKQSVDHPLTLYAATKQANELMAHSYSSLYGLPTTGLRFFTVYGPWGRPDMALFLFTRKILAGEPIDVYDGGRHQRDFTYVDDIVAGVGLTLDKIATPDPKWNPKHPTSGTSNVPYRIYNIGNQRPVTLDRYIEVLEQNLHKKAIRNLLPRQIGDLQDTWADVSALQSEVGYEPRTTLEEGVRRFVEWYLGYYQPQTT